MLGATSENRSTDKSLWPVGAHNIAKSTNQWLILWYHAIDMITMRVDKFMRAYKHMQWYFVVLKWLPKCGLSDLRLLWWHLYGYCFVNLHIVGSHCVCTFVFSDGGDTGSGWWSGWVQTAKEKVCFILLSLVFIFLFIEVVWVVSVKFDFQVLEL